VQVNIRTILARLNGVPAASDNFQAPYDALKAYLMLTSETSDRDKVDPAFLVPYLLERWTGSHSSAGEKERDLARRQFEFFATKLKSDKSLAMARENAVVERARTYLKAFESAGRLYQLMLAEAEKSGSPIQFSRQPSESTVVLTNRHAVPAAYTKAGWKVMQDALRNPQRYSSGEQWVLGGESTRQISPSEADGLRVQYVQAYISQWQQFLKATTIQGFSDLRDAASKLGILGAPSSPLLELLFKASDNTNVDSPEVKTAFRSVQSFVKPDSPPGNYVGDPNRGYMKALVQLQISVERLTSLPARGPIEPQLLAQARQDVATAKLEARQAGQAMGNDNTVHMELTVQGLLEAPIRMTDSLLSKLGASTPN
jgi:type VI protein secretion system component VasK